MAMIETCNHDLKRNSCDLSPAESGEYDVIATSRMIVATLSLIGTLTIIILAIGKKQVLKYEVHPIFILSVADLILACLWIIGGSFWLRGVDNKIWCLATSLITVIVQCVTINLTLVYAILAYRGSKKAGISQNLLNEQSFSIHKVWTRPVTIAVYVCAWVTPMVIVLLTFAIVVASSKDITERTNQCSCWCLPVYVNTLPYAIPRDHPTALYVFDIHKLLASFGSVISFHYLVVFILLVIIYYKLLKHIKKLLSEFEKTHRTYQYDFTISTIIGRQSKARRRVTLFLLIFFINGFFNFLLSFGLTAFEAYRLPHGPQINVKTTTELLRGWHLLFIILLILQSLTLPLQGFLNAIVYGWTRDDFINTLNLISQDVNDQTDKKNIPNTKPKVIKTEKSPYSAVVQNQMTNYLLSSDDSAGDTEIETDIEGFNANN